MCYASPGLYLVGEGLDSSKEGIQAQWVCHANTTVPSVAVLQPHALRGSHREARRRARGRRGGGYSYFACLPGKTIDHASPKGNAAFSPQERLAMVGSSCSILPKMAQQGFPILSTQPLQTWSGHSLLLIVAIAFVSPPHSSRISLSQPSLNPITAVRSRKRLCIPGFSKYMQYTNAAFALVSAHVSQNVYLLCS